MRSRFAHSLLLVRYSVFIALGGDVRRFSQLILSVSHQGKAAAYVGVAVLRLVFSSRLYVHRSLFIRVVASKKRRRFPSPPLASCLTPSNPPPVASFASLIRLVPRPVVRLAARLVLMPYRLIASFSSHPVPSCPMCRTLAARLAAAPFCSARLAVLPMPCRPCRPCRSHRLMTG